MAWSSDVFAMMRGLEKVMQALATHQRAECSRLWLNSSVRSAVHDMSSTMEDKISDVLVRQDTAKVIADCLEKLFKTITHVRADVLF